MKIKFIIGAIILSLSLVMDSCTKDSVSIPIESSSKQELVSMKNAINQSNSSVTTNADPSIALSLTPSSIQVGSNTTLNVDAGNHGNGTILVNTLRVLIGVGTNAEILGLAPGSDPRWTILSSTTGSGNTIRLTNTGGSFGAMDTGTIKLIVKGLTVSTPDLIVGNIVYITANNPALGGAPNTQQGNMDIINDNSQIGLTVTAGITTNADPGIALSLNSSSIPKGSNTILKVAAGNYGSGTILANTLRITIGIGTNAEILGLAAGSDPRWTILSSSTGSGNTIRLINTGGSFGAMTYGTIKLKVKGRTASTPDLIMGNIVYITANNPALGGAPNVQQGNTTTGNDNSQTPLTVTVN